MLHYPQHLTTNMNKQEVIDAYNKLSSDVKEYLQRDPNLEIVRIMKLDEECLKLYRALYNNDDSKIKSIEDFAREQRYFHENIERKLNDIQSFLIRNQLNTL